MPPSLTLPRRSTEARHMVNSRPYQNTYGRKSQRSHESSSANPSLSDLDYAEHPTGETVANASQLEVLFEEPTVIPNTDISVLDSGASQLPTSCTTVTTTSSDDVQFIAGPFKATSPRKSLPRELAAAKHQTKEARERTDVILSKQRENLNCHICLLIVNRPFILSCGHFFCAECISECAKYHVQKRTNPKCPDCRVITGHFTPIEAHHLQQMAVALRSELGIAQPPRGSLKDEPSKLSSLSSPPDLSSKSTSSPDNPKPKLHRPSASAASDLRLKYQTLSRHADEASNYDMRVMAAAISSSVQSATPQLPSIESSLQNFQTEITKQTVKSMLSASAAVPSIEENSLESLLVADRLGRLQFGDPRKRNTKVMRALMSVSSLHDAASDLKTRLDDLSRTQTTAEIQSILCAVEDGSETLRREIASSTAAVSVKAKEVRGVLDSIEQSVQLWRREYPDTAPVKIDNRKCFFDPGQDKNSPTIIAYCIALVARVFERTAQRGATFILKMIKIFGYTLATLGGRNLNTDQEIALAEIPESIERLEKKFNLDVDCVPYAVCPKCSKIYAPSFPNGASHPVYPPICLERQTPSEEPCSTSLLSYGKPAKIFEYYPFFDWFGKFISLPGIEEYGDKFCEAVESHQNVPNKKVDQTDGCFVHEFPGADAQLFIADRGSEGRWLFTLNADFFNAEGNRIRGKKSSTGMMAMSCLNLPLKMRNDHAYLYIPGIIQGPQEPNAINAEHRHYLKPLIDDLLTGYTRGIRPYATHRTYGQNCPYDRVFRVALALVLMDFKAARPFSGFLDVTSHHFCYMCDCWHVSHLGRTDYEEWKSADDAFLRKGAELWRDAPDIKKRKILEDIFGTRASEFWRLPYWKASIQLGIDPMHTMFLILLQRYFRDILGLDNPDDPKRTPKKPKFKFAFYYDFTPPPPLSSLVNQEDATRLRTSINGYDSQPIDDNLLSLLEWPHLSMEHSAYRWARLQSLQVQVANDSRAQQAVLDILNDLSERAPTTEAQRHQLYSRIQRHKWSAILYVCDNLAIFPNASGPDLRNSSQITQKDVTKRELSNILLHWRTNEIKEEYSFIWPFFTPSDIPPPIIPWATHHASIPDQDNHPTYRKFSPGERLSLLKELAASMSYHSASHVGNLHRLLQKPMAQDHKDDLRKALKQSNADALAYVCADIERLPVNKFNKDHLVDQLMTWRMSKPLEQMPSIELDSSGLLHRIQQVIREAVTPAWVTNPPPNVGLAQAGTLKAEHWRTLFSIHVPLAVLSLWKEHSPSASPDASSMTSLVDTTMYLACASIVMAKRTLSVERRNLYCHLLRLHILGLKQDFPGWIFPTHHLAFHIFDGMNNFSGVRNWWLFPFENLIGKLQRIPTNHIAGQFEHTMLHSFCKGASFRQWLLRENSPPILKYCQQLLDKAYNYDRGSSTPPPPVAQDDDIDESEVLTTVNAELVASNFVQPDSKYKILPSPTLTRMLGTEPFECFSRIPGSKGDYTIPGKGAIGNSNVCFQAQGNYRPGQRWLAGQIRHIFRQTKSSPIQVGICRSMPTSTPHPFSDYWANGFEADIVASKFSNSLEIINFSQIAGHSARWSISDDLVVVVNLCSVLSLQD
ncbi:hypothetical protein F5051DRAFT_433362 [Lentinula edodes]|nr:hypothetical protein F5051DRAFT_433362 [Lentinula edodes]